MKNHYVCEPVPSTTNTFVFQGRLVVLKLFIAKKLKTTVFTPVVQPLVAFTFLQGKR
jgi:hypothetical protein